jgi:hypothetical protein
MPGLVCFCYYLQIIRTLYCVKIMEVALALILLSLFTFSATNYFETLSLLYSYMVAAISMSAKTCQLTFSGIGRLLFI